MRCFLHVNIENPNLLPPIQKNDRCYYHHKRQKSNKSTNISRQEIVLGLVFLLNVVNDCGEALLIIRIDS